MESHQPHAPGGAGRAGRTDTAQTGKRHAPEGAGVFNTCSGVLREGNSTEIPTVAIRSG